MGSKRRTQDCDGLLGMATRTPTRLIASGTAPGISANPLLNTPRHGGIARAKMHVRRFEIRFDARRVAGDRLRQSVDGSLNFAHTSQGLAEADEPIDMVRLQRQEFLQLANARIQLAGFQLEQRLAVTGRRQPRPSSQHGVVQVAGLHDVSPAMFRRPPDATCRFSWPQSTDLTAPGLKRGNECHLSLTPLAMASTMANALGLRAPPGPRNGRTSASLLHFC